MRDYLEINLLKNVLERLKIMDTKLKVLEKINLLNTEFECININPEFTDTKLFCEKYSYPMEKSCNTIIVASKKRNQTVYK